MNWERCGRMSVVEFGKLERDDRDSKFRVTYKGRLVDVGWIGFFYRAVNDPQLFVTLFGVGDGIIGQGDRAAITKVDKMLPCLLVYKRARTK